MTAKPTPEPRHIPKTELRYFYENLKLFSTTTQLCMLNDLLRGNSYLKLVEMYKTSKEIFEKYDNNEESFLGNASRKEITATDGKLFKGTEDVIALWMKSENSPTVEVFGNRNLDFIYIDREVRTFRTTGSYWWNTCENANKSGQGGLDFIAWNGTPVLGEIKVCGDENPFYALVQLVTYLSEISTENQIKRINKHKLFGNAEQFLTFDLYVVLADYNFNGKEKQQIFNGAVDLARTLENSIPEIGRIVFLETQKAGRKIWEKPKYDLS